MRNVRTTAAAAALVVAGVGALAATGVSPAGAAPSQDPTLKDVRAANARFHSVQQAEAAGYVAGKEPCVSSPAGAMGIHFSKPGSLADDAIDPLQPEMLVYLPNEDGQLKLVAVEYWKRDADQSMQTTADRPTLFGQPFNGPMPGHSPGMPVHYDLHVWLYADNPAGTFAPFNPSLRCP